MQLKDYGSKDVVKIYANLASLLILWNIFGNTPYIEQRNISKVKVKLSL
jgi:hypothetical protein